MLDSFIIPTCSYNFKQLFQNSKASYIRTRDSEENAQVSIVESPCSSSFTNHSQLPSQVTDAGSPISTQMSEYEDAETGTIAILQSLICYALHYGEYNFTDSYFDYAPFQCI